MGLNRVMICYDYHRARPLSIRTPCQPSIAVAYQISVAKAHNYRYVHIEGADLPSRNQICCPHTSTSILKHGSFLYHKNIVMRTWQAYKSHIPNLAGKIGRARAQVFHSKSKGSWPAEKKISELPSTLRNPIRRCRDHAIQHRFLRVLISASDGSSRTYTRTSLSMKPIGSTTEGSGLDKWKNLDQKIIGRETWKISSRNRNQKRPWPVIYLG
ncbi:hypothetical protein CY34DRAFT_301139 [Suillus luteus UH-Slu-Lm8-n1]|uniref:Uncharacterized protein n=1 Tax=Suillus luteus UH-Slu-Lm8-n1 TaxID=930992 RepID=A0A0D0APB7_9AGAM|nr:hypothetical protein CY34DRAFT_301139 [Suillus luteus UH-Slu-Lm8-n1]